MQGGQLVLEQLHCMGFVGSTRGGVVGMRGAGAQNLTLRRSIFSHNQAEWYGGALYAYGADGDVAGSALLHVEDVEFVENSAVYNGGAVHFNGLYGNVTASFVRCTWVGNRAAHGAAVANLFGKISLSDASVAHNGAAVVGGGYYQYTAGGSPAAQSLFSRANFSNNSGGDLVFHTVQANGSASTAVLCDSRFDTLDDEEAEVHIDDPSLCGDVDGFSVV